MENNKQRKAQQDLASLDNALREVRGVGLNQKLDAKMMGGQVSQRRQDSGYITGGQGASDGQQTLSMSKDPAGTSIKLPHITRGSHSSNQGPFLVDGSNRQLNNNNDGAATTHHLNVTLGEDKFYYTANENAQRLPNITNQSADSKNDYVGLMSSKKYKDRGSVDFNVQNSFTVGGPAFNPNDPSKDENRMMTIDPEVNQKLINKPSRGHQRGVSLGGARARNNQIQTLQTNLNQSEQDAPGSASYKGNPSTFENYIGRVITSVQHRKKNPRLKSLFNQGSHQGSMEKYANAIEPHGDYGSVSHQLNETALISQSMMQQNLNQTHSAISDENSAISHLTKGTKSNIVAVANSFQKTAAQSIIAKSQTTQVSLLGNRDVEQKEPKATEQVAYLLRQIQKKGQIFQPLELVKDPNSNIMFKENKNPPEDFGGAVIFSKNGFVSVAPDKNGITNFISNEQYIEDGVTNQILKEIPFFKKFQQLRFFIQWKTKMRLNAYERKRQKLAANYIFSKPVFAEKYRQLIPAMNCIRDLSLIEIQANVTYGKKQQSTLEEKCKSVLDQNRQAMEELLVTVKDFMIQLKKEILADDERFENEIKESKVQEMIKNKHKNQLVMFNKQRVRMEAIEEQYRQKRLRHTQYDNLLLMVFRYWSTKVVQLLLDSKERFNNTFSDTSSGTLFEITICFSPEGKLDSDPLMDDHVESFKQVFQDMEQAVFNNQFLKFFMHDMNDLFFGKPTHFTKTVFDQMQKILDMNRDYKENHKSIFECLNRDVAECQQIINEHKHLQEVHDFCQNWTQGRNDKQISLEMGFYKETWVKMDEFTAKIAKVRSGNEKHGTILVDTSTLKKQLTEMPKQVIESIRHNVTQTMEQETKTLREELGKTSEILDQLPTSLNTYVEQVNTLKYIDHKREDFDAKFQTINKLNEQCKQDNIKVSINLAMAIDDVKVLYETLPKLQKTSAEQLAQNKETMERIMNSSSGVLSKKIKAFEKKYVETYLHDKTRLDDCGDTLEELFKRSKAIHEIRSKVILYREFLKLLYENDKNPQEKMAQNKLSCAEDFENLQEIHKHTIRLWKILLYWKKRRQMCYNTPFLNLDTQMIITSIHKVTKYLDSKLPQHDFVQRQSQNICKLIYKQVEETNLIIEFVKDLRKDCLYNRHWMQIFDLIKAPHLKSQNKFTIVDLREYNIQNYKEDIHHIIEHANTEAKYETIFKCICEEWEKLDLKIIPFKDTQNSYIMVNTETLNQAIEENLNTLEVISQSEFAAHIKNDILAWIDKLKTMHKNLDIWIGAQRYWINLDIIYNSAIFSNIFGEKTKQFINTRLQFQRIMWSSYKNPKAIYNLMIDSRIKVFIEMTAHFQVLQKKVHEFLEEKRLVFSRFYFLNDSQFLEFLTLANTSQDFSMYINTLFVGAQNLYIQPADQVKLSKNENNKDFVEIDDEISEEEDSIMSDEDQMQGEKKSLITGQNSVENSKMGIVGVNDYQVLGMISPNKELLLFETPVLIENDNHAIKEVEGFEVSGTGTGNVEQWLIKVERSMNETMKNQMQYAVKSFATRSLDEWVLDYPQQIVMTALNLVLTNEINDILEEKQRLKELEDAEGSDNGDDDDDGGPEDDAQEEEEKKEEDEKQGDEKPGESVQKDSVEDTGANKRVLKGTVQPKMSPDERRRRLLVDLFGPDFKPDDRFEKALVQAKDDIQTRRVQQAQAAGAKTVKKNLKKTEAKDWIMELLGQQSFYGIFMRIQFWINKIIRSMNDERKSDWQDKQIEFNLTGVQQMVIRNVILFLTHQRDSVDKMMTLDINDKNDFEWLSKVKVMWNDNDSDLTGPVIQCGGWQQQLGTEYLGSNQRLPLSPLTDRYYVFLSSALREKSGVLFRCNQYHQHSADVFEEFAHQCHMPYKSLQCNQDMQVAQLMQVINGAAMARFWVFLEHLDNLPLVNFQIIIKEIQMVQQQYIIAELNDQDVSGGANFVNKGMSFKENKNTTKESLENQQAYSTQIVDNQKRYLTKQGSIIPAGQVSQKLIGAMRPSLGIFGSLSSRIIIKNPDIAQNLNLLAQSTFRTISLAKPDQHFVINCILKSEGFYYYQKISKIMQEFLVEFTNKKNEALYGEGASESEKIMKTTEQMVLRDIRAGIRASILLYEQEWKGYLDKIFKQQERSYKFELQLNEKPLHEKVALNNIYEEQRKKVLLDKEDIEIDSLREGFKNVLKSKFFNEWRSIKTKQLKLQHSTQNIRSIRKPKLNEKEHEAQLDGLILTAFKTVRDRVKKEWEEQQKKEDGPAKVELTAVNKKRPMKRRLTHSSTVSLLYATKRGKNEEMFQDSLNDAFEQVIDAMKISERPDQLYHCLGVVEYMRRQKAVAIVGPVCSGKTQILKIVSQALKLAYDIIFRTSAVNPSTFNKDELYGPINAFASQDQKDQDDALRKKSIFQIILDNYQHEKLMLDVEARNNFVQSFLIDSNKIDSSFMDSLIQFIQKSNIREREYYDNQEFLLHISSLGQAHDTLIQHLPVTFPNGNVIMLPSDLYFFFETESLSNASPLFLSQVGIVITQDSDFNHSHLFQKNLEIYKMKHEQLSEKLPHKINLFEHFESCTKEFLNPMIDLLDKDEAILEWHLWNKKSLILQFFKLLNSMTYRLGQACDKNQHNEDEMLFPIREMEKDAVWSIILTAFIMSFGVSFNNELQKVFIDKFKGFKKMFNINIHSKSVQQPTIIDIYFDIDRLSWEVIQEKLEFKLKLGFYPKMSALLVPTASISLSYFILEQLTYYLKFDPELNKNFRVLGPQGTSKSVILNTFIQRSKEQFDSVIVPMSSHLSIDRLRINIEKLYVAKRKKIFVPKNSDKKIIIMIDDLHLQSNMNLNVVEFMRTWTQSNGYFDVGAGFFKRITDFSVVMAQNSNYRVEKCKVKGRKPLDNRMLFYTNTQYCDEMPIEKYKYFVQHWLTSKMWSPNRLLQKYYIIITNGIISLLEKVKRSDQLGNSSFSPLYSFDILAKFCSSLVINTIISDDPWEISGGKQQREEDSMANVVIYEVLRNYADRIYKPQDRMVFITKAAEIFRHEFQMKESKPEYLDSMIMGNFHENKASVYIKLINNTENKSKVKDIMMQKIAEKSNNHLLVSVLDTPNGIRDVFRLSRILFKEQQHLILCGSPSSQKHELLQISTILNDVVMMEMNVPKYNAPSKFSNSFKQVLLNVIRQDDINCYIVICDEQLRDPMYIDYIYNYIAFIGKDEECILMDETFKQQITDIETEQFMKNKDNFKYDKNKKPEPNKCLQNGIEKLKKHAHIVLMINDMQTYHEWFSLFPGLETKCDVMFIDDLTTDGYHQLTRTFLERSKIDEDMEENEKTNLVKSMVQAKDIAKNKIFDNFYTQEQIKNYVVDEYMNGQGVENIYPNQNKAHFYIFDDAHFKVYDPLLKQVNYNIRAELSLVMKARYGMFLEVFRFLYDFLSLNLSIRKNYYETFISKTRQFNSFFDEINSKKKDLHFASNNINYKMTMIQDKINRINKSVHDKKLTIQKRKAEIQDLELQLKNQRDEVDQVLADKNASLNEVLDDIQKLNESDINAVVSMGEYSIPEQALLNLIVMIIEKDPTIEYDRNSHDNYFLEPEEFYDILNDRRNSDFNDACFKKLKDFVGKFSSTDFPKPIIFKKLFSYLSELYRKLNVRNTMSQQFQQISEIKANIDSNYFSINYSEHYIKEKQIELQARDEQIVRIQARDNKLSKKIEVAEISHMRTQHIFDSVKEYGQKIKLKLEIINSRIQALLGDCIVLSASICFLGFFSSDERMEIRNEIVKFVGEVQDINCSKDWTIDGNNPNPKVQNKMFKSILKEYGLRQILLSHNYSGILTESTICEVLFHMIFAPSCPLIIDPTGEVQEYVKSRIISKLHVKQLHGSDLNINQQLQHIFKSQGSFGLLNDVNNFEKASFGLTLDQPLLHRLSETFYNGIDFNYDRASQWKKVPGIEDHIFNSFNCMNKKMPVNEPGLENVSLYQVQIYSPSFDFQNGGLFMSKGSCFVAMSSNEDIFNNTVGVNAWMEIKELLLEQINNHEYKQLQEVKAQIRLYEENKSSLNRAYENNFLVANHDTLQNITEYTALKQSIEDIENQTEERLLYKRLYSEMIAKYEILTYYSKVILNMFLSLKVMSKIMNEVTSSWKMFKSILHQILKQVIKNLAQEALAKKKVNQKKNSSKPQVDIDLRFFQKSLIPKLHKTLVTSVRQDSSAPLFNLIFALRIALLQEKITIQENTYFFKQLLLLKNFQLWRKTELDFVDMTSHIPKARLNLIKREVSRLYPKFGKQFVETVEADLGNEFKYQDASIYLFKLFKDPKFRNLTLIHEICLGFLCPDHEFKSKLTQFMYQQLSEVFDFSEEYSRLHQLLSRASWKHPISLLSVSHVNMINTISSIAQHYGVGLDVIRTDQESDRLIYEQQRGINVRADNLIKENLKDQTGVAMLSIEQKYARLQTMATSYLKTGNICSDLLPPITKVNFMQNAMRQQFINPDMHISEQKEEDPIRLIERSARKGSWVLISTIRFPQFRQRLVAKLDQLREQDAIDDKFRLILDLQSYAQNDISDSFLFDNSVSFHMTEQNTEEFEGFDDIWSAILDERVLIKLTEKIEAQRQKIKNEQVPMGRYAASKAAKSDDSASEKFSESEQSVKGKGQADPESPSNFKLIERTIKSDTQKSLYKQFMSESKKENEGLKFDLMKAQEPTEHSEEEDPVESPLHNIIPEEEEQKRSPAQVTESTIQQHPTLVIGTMPDDLAKANENLKAEDFATTGRASEDLGKPQIIKESQSQTSLSQQNPLQVPDQTDQTEGNISPKKLD